MRFCILFFILKRISLWKAWVSYWEIICLENLSQQLMIQVVMTSVTTNEAMDVESLSAVFEASLSSQIFVQTLWALWFLNLSEKPNLKSKSNFLDVVRQGHILKQSNEPADQSWKVMPPSPNWHRLTCQLTFQFLTCLFHPYPVDCENWELSVLKGAERFVQSFNLRNWTQLCIGNVFYPSWWIMRNLGKGIPYCFIVTLLPIRILW